MSCFPGQPAIRLFIGDVEAHVTDVQINIKSLTTASIRNITVHAVLTDEMIEAAKVSNEEIIEGLKEIQGDLS